MRRLTRSAGKGVGFPKNVGNAGFGVCEEPDGFSSRSFHARSGLRSSSWVLGLARRVARPPDARVPFERGRGGRGKHI